MPRRPRKKPTPENEAGRVLRHAANVLEDREWVQGREGTLKGGMCAIGVIRQSHARPQLDRALGAELLFADWLIDAGLTTPYATPYVSCCPEVGTSSFSTITHWNDAEGRTKEEVITVMRKFADEKDPQSP